MPLLLAFGAGIGVGVYGKSELDGGVNTLFKVAAIGGVYLAWKHLK